MRLLRRLLRELHSNYKPDESKIIRINNKYFLLEQGQGLHSRKNLVYAGLYLGQDRRTFEPSAILLQILSKGKDARKVNVDRETAWLFVCGRDVFQENILQIEQDLNLGSSYLVMYNGMCLGYGRYETIQGNRMIRNNFNIGDFLHREK